MLAGTACAVLMLSSAPAAAAATPNVPSARPFAMFGEPAVDAFYASRNGRLLWLEDANRRGAAAVIQVLKRSAVEGFAEGPGIATQAEALLARSGTGDRTALLSADRLLSTGWVKYVELLRRPPADTQYAEQWIAPRAESPSEILSLAGASPSLADHVHSVSTVNPFYAQLRDAAWAQFQATGVLPDRRLSASLERARAFPAKGRYLVVDAASARLWMVDDGRAVDSMKVIVGSKTNQTPMIASVIHYATLNPYWNVPPDLVRTLIAPNVLSQGAGYLKARGYELLSGFGDDPQVLSPGDVDWKAVAAGEAQVRIRQLPSEGNSMGHVKFGFANDSGIYLHDTPKKELFAESGRDLSHGCVRLEDAERLGRWLLGREVQTASNDPEQHVQLPAPVPVFVTYLTAHAEKGQITFVDDVYGRDSQSSAVMASLR